MHMHFTQHGNGTELHSEVHGGVVHRRAAFALRLLEVVARVAARVDGFAQHVGAGPRLGEGKVGAGRRVLVQ